MMGSVLGRGSQYIQLVKVLHCKLPTISKQLPTFPHKVLGLNHQPQRWEARMLPLCHRSPQNCQGNCLTCVVLHNMLRSHQGGVARAPTPANDIATIANEPALHVYD